MKPKTRWIDKLLPMEVDTCIPIHDTPIQSIYSALWDNKELLTGRKYRVHKIEKFVCRVK